MTAHTFQQRVNQKFINDNLTIDYIEKFFNEDSLIELLKLNYKKFKNKQNGTILFDYILSKSIDNNILFNEFISYSYYKYKLSYSFSILNREDFLNLLKKYELSDFIAEFSIINMDIDLFKEYYSDISLFIFENKDIINYIKDKKAFINFFNEIYDFLLTNENEKVFDLKYMEELLTIFFCKTFIKYIDEYSLLEAIKNRNSFTYNILKKNGDYILNVFKFIKKDTTIKNKIYIINLFTSEIKVTNKNSIENFLEVLEGYNYIKNIINNLDSDKDKYSLMNTLKNSNYIKYLHKYKDKAQKEYIDMKNTVNKLEKVFNKNNFDIIL